MNMKWLMVLFCFSVLLAPAVKAETEESESVGNNTAVHLDERVTEWLRSKGFSKSMAVGAISVLPIIELRGAVPVGHHFLYKTSKMKKADRIRTSLKIYGLAVVGNMIPIPFILLLLGPVSGWMMRFAWGRKFFEWLFARTRRKSANIEKYEELGLTIFVAIPLPVTGAWTGAMAAFLMGLPFWKSMLFILLGVMIAGVIMTILSLMGWPGALLAGGVLLALVAGAVLKNLKNKE